MPLATDEERRDQKDEHSEKRLVDFGLLLLTAALAVATFLLWKTTADLAKETRAGGEMQSEKMQASIDQATRSAAAMEDVARATRDNAALMQSVMHKQMRAYVAVNIGSAAYQENEKGIKFAAHPVLENTGFTPARTVNFKVMAGVFEFPLPADFVFPDVPVFQIYDTSIAPRQTFVINGIVNDIFIDDEVKEIMKGDTKRLFVWGAVTYNDIYNGGPWQTNFCHHYYYFKNREGGVIPMGSLHTVRNDGT
ncbi:hypothetical protein [Collimonas antrihumi]|uniref:hypothetical protein n=1 Tax=Collimonas antrihumi TaxID=1940615 RepID=UPI001B8B4EF3|nr:hypothetical protein [Collimonas antrihumi]